ncbi:MAG: hypothetical protein ACJ73J_07915 [Actinomycetes bacterium]
MATLMTAAALVLISIAAVLLLTGRALRGQRGGDPGLGPQDWPEDSHFWHTQGIR